MKGPAFLIVAGLYVLAAFTAGPAQSRGIPQEPSEITGKAWQQLFQSDNSTYRALSLMSDIYAPRINKGVIPDRETLYGLGRVLDVHLANHPADLERPLQDLVLKVLRDGPARIEEHKALWRSALAAAQQYFSDPSPANASRFYAALPTKRLPGLDFAGYVRLSEYVYDQKLSVLSQWMKEGNPYALDIGFRLWNISDGAFGEDLLHYLGQTVSNHPRLFLEKLIANRDMTEPPIMNFLDSILDPVGWWEIPDDDPDDVKYRKLLYERIDNRKRALEKVTDPQLIEVRDLCLRVLELLRNEVRGMAYEIL